MVLECCVSDMLFHAVLLMLWLVFSVALYEQVAQEFVLWCCVEEMLVHAVLEIVWEAFSVLL